MSPGRALVETQPSHTEAAVGESFDGFFRREYTSVVGLATVLAGNRTLGEEIAQEAFLAAHRSWERIGVYDRPGAWVRRVVANHAASATRMRVREARALFRLAARREPAAPLPEIGADEFWQAVRALPRRQAQCVALHYFEDRSTAEIASLLGITETTVRVHLHDGRVALARHLGESETS